jgi:anaerobic magnesium-protoporphyrin IX monomethyl ester cyclase
MHKRDSVDLVLVNPGNLELIYQSLASDLSAIEPPVWAGLMATFVRMKGYSVAIIDANAERLTPQETATRVVDLNPTLTVVVVYGHQPSASTQNMTSSGVVCSAIKQVAPELKLMLVGGHVAALPGRTLQEEDVDFVSNGEGLYTMADLLECLKAGGADLHKVRGLQYLQDGVVQRTVSAPLFRELDDEMPGIAWDLLPMERYRAHNWHCLDTLQRQPYVALYTTLGCPYHCNFCCIQAPFKSGESEVGIKENINSYRFWSPDTVIREIDLLVNEYGVRNIKIADEMFVLNRKHIEGICDRIIERGYDLNIWAYARVDTVKDGMSEKLKQAGFNWLAFGIEAANERVRGDVQKGFGQDLIYKTLNDVRGADINIIGNFIFGLPEDDIVTMQETLDMAIELNCEFVNLYCAMAYPGSELYDVAIKEDMSLPREWNDYSQHAKSCLPLPTKYLTASEVLRFRDHAFQVYFNSPSYLNMIEKRFGMETVRHIQGMAKHKLERDILQETTN